MFLSQTRNFGRKNLCCLLDFPLNDSAGQESSFGLTPLRNKRMFSPHVPIADRQPLKNASSPQLVPLLPDDVEVFLIGSAAPRVIIDATPGNSFELARIEIN